MFLLNGLFSRRLGLWVHAVDAVSRREFFAFFQHKPSKLRFHFRPLVFTFQNNSSRRLVT